MIDRDIGQHVPVSIEPFQRTCRIEDDHPGSRRDQGEIRKAERAVEIERRIAVVHAVMDRDVHAASIVECHGVGANDLTRSCELRHAAAPAHAVDETAEIVLQRRPQVGMAAEIGDFRDRTAREFPGPELRIGENSFRLADQASIAFVQPEKMASIVEAQR